MQVVITVAGLGTRFSNQGILTPKPMTEVMGRPAIQYLIDCFPSSWQLVFVIGEHFRESDLVETIKRIRPGSFIAYTPYSERGPVDTVLAAKNYLRTSEPTLVSYCDYSLVWNALDFVEKVSASHIDAAIVTYQGFHPTYLGPNSYCHVLVEQLNQRIVTLQEKKLFTDHLEKEITSVGLYYFKSAEFLFSCLSEQLQQGLKYGREYYISLAIQAMMNSHPSTLVKNYQVEQMLQLGTPSDVERAEYWYNLLILKNSEPIQLRWNKIDPGDMNYEIEKTYWMKLLFHLFKVSVAR